jgi:hypothetical protein
VRFQSSSCACKSSSLGEVAIGNNDRVVLNNDDLLAAGASAQLKGGEVNIYRLGSLGVHAAACSAPLLAMPPGSIRLSTSWIRRTLPSWSMR